MPSQSFEIKVAIVGHVSVGKTTVLNALLGEKFSEVSMRKATSGINHFRISNEAKVPQTKKLKQQHNEYIVSSKESLNQITKDNNILREQNVIQETIYDVKLDQELLPMRDNTRLVLTDIPGINEAHASEKYIKYVKDSWKSFDCCVVVMDVNQGVNTEGEVKLLQLIKGYLTNIRHIPVVVLANKVDEPENPEVHALVDEVCKEVEKVFNVIDRKKALDGILSQSSTRKLECTMSPAFVPVSAENAYLYRRASGTSFEEFQMFSKNFIDKIGREEFGRFKWKKLSFNEQCELVYGIVSDEEQYKERLAESNFDKLIKVLEYFIGGNYNQIKLIEKQLNLTLENLTSDSAIADRVSAVYDRYKVLGLKTDHLVERFWEMYSKCELKAVEKLSQSPLNIVYIHKLMDDLVKYDIEVHSKHFQSLENSKSLEQVKEDKDRIFESMIWLMKKVYKVVLEKLPGIATNTEYRSSWVWQSENKRWYNTRLYCTNSDMSRHPDGNIPADWVWVISQKKWQHKVTGYKAEAKPLLDWKCVYLHDTFRILTSLSMMSQNEYFCKHFWNDILNVQWKRQTVSLNHISNQFGEACIHRIKHCNDTLIIFPDSVENHEHWGYGPWLFCKYAKMREKKNYA